MELPKDIINRIPIYPMFYLLKGTMRQFHTRMAVEVFCALFFVDYAKTIRSSE